MVLAGACSYGILSTLVKLAYAEGYNTAEISVTQAFIGMCFLWMFVLFQRRNSNTGPSFQQSKKQWLTLLLSGTAIGLASFLYYLSVRYISASVAVVIMMQFTWISILLDWLFFKKKPRLAELLIIGVILTGTVMASKIIHADATSKTGVLYALASALLYALYIVANSKIVINIPPVKKGALMMLGSTAGVVIVNAHSLIINHHFDLGLLKWGIVLALFGTIIPPLLFANSISKTGAALSSILMAVEIPVAVICSHLLLKEQVSLVQWLGIMLMLLSIVMLNIGKLKKQNDG
ncbi:MAG: EamA/RhaT family transporter [Mucilaginibacter sp.]|nr:EamA/RhaT family transporter [Mucilaginibacter sp.]